MEHLLEEIALADRVGLYSFGIGEHHRSEYYDSAPAVILAAAAARTEPIMRRSMAQRHVDAVLTSDQAEHFTHRRLIVELAETYSLPTMTPWLENVEIGGLIAYGPDRKGMYRYLASCVDKVLKRENPGEIPIYQSVSFKLAINLKTAKALGLDIPANVLARADEVIE